MYAPRMPVSRYDPTICLQTFKGKSFTCNSIGLPMKERCAACKKELEGGTKAEQVEAIEPDLHFQDREPETWVAEEIMKALEL